MYIEIYREILGGYLFIERQTNEFWFQVVKASGLNNDYPSINLLENDLISQTATILSLTWSLNKMSQVGSWNQKKFILFKDNCYIWPGPANQPLLYVKSPGFTC